MSAQRNRSILAALFVLAAPLMVAPGNGNASAGGALPVDVLDRMMRLSKLAPLPQRAFPTTPALQAKLDLGRRLFFDQRLSLNRTMSCATCHDPAKGFADGQALGKGFDGKRLRRHSPTVLNAVYSIPQFWDGRASGLEEQATGPVMSSAEMNMGTEANVVARLLEQPEYGSSFQAIYGAPPNLKLMGDAIAAYESTLTTPDSPFDRYLRGERSALTAPQKRGLALFIGKAACAQCHSGPALTDQKFHNIGLLPSAGVPADLGRFEVTKRDDDRGAFKTPTLRNVAITAPYMHDGSMATLEEVVAHYNKGGADVPNKSNLIFALALTPQESRDLVAFLHSLTGTLPGAPSRGTPAAASVSLGDR